MASGQQLAEQNGSFKVLQDSIAGITEDRRLQLLLIAFAFGAFFEGAAGFGTPVAVTAAILIGLGFSPLAASGLSLIAKFRYGHDRVWDGSLTRFKQDVRWGVGSTSNRAVI